METFLSFFSKIPLGVLLGLSALSVVLGDLFAKYWSLNSKPLFYVIAIIGYLFSSFFYIPALLRESLVITSIIWSVLSIIGFMFIGLVLFKETLSPMQLVGVGLGILSLIVLSSAH